jgi:hypothetical protein
LHKSTVAVAFSGLLHLKKKKNTWAPTNMPSLVAKQVWGGVGRGSHAPFFKHEALNTNAKH